MSKITTRNTLNTEDSPEKTQVFTYSFAKISHVIAHNHANRRHLYTEQQTSVCLKTCTNNKSHTKQSSASERNVRHVCVCA